jgi:hypothetical protein
MGNKRLWQSIKAFQDPRIKMMVAKYGHAYYALYWMILEILFRKEGTRLKVDGDKKILSSQRHLNSEELKHFIVSCIEEFGLFHSDGLVFWSDLDDTNIYAYSEHYPGE